MELCLHIREGNPGPTGMLRGEDKNIRMLSPALLTLGPLPDLSFSISTSYYSLDVVSPSTSFPPSSTPGNNHSQNKDMLRNTFKSPSSAAAAACLDVLRCGLESVYQHGREGKWHTGVFCLVAAVWRGFILLFPFTPDESAPPSASGVIPRAADAGHIQHPQRGKPPRCRSTAVPRRSVPRLSDPGPRANLRV